MSNNSYYAVKIDFFFLVFTVKWIKTRERDRMNGKHEFWHKTAHSLPTKLVSISLL